MADRESTTRTSRIVVGIDGSDPSRAVLKWAAAQAKLTNAPLEVVMTWEYPTNYGWVPLWPDGLDLSADAKRLLDEVIDGVLGRSPDIAITATVVEGHPAPVLVDRSKSAGLVVVGSRGHGEFTGMLIGSVSEFLATHAHCPVVVVRDGGSHTRG